MKAFIVTVLLLIPIIFTSCKKPVKGCTDSIAENYSAKAEEDDGTCVYFADNYTGVFSGVKTCQIYQSDPNFTFEITRISGKQDKISLDGFPESGVSTIANINFSSPNQIIIPNQSIHNDLDDSEISGTAVLSGNSLAITYYRLSFEGIDTSHVSVSK